MKNLNVENLSRMEQDVLHHIGSTKDINISTEFGDVKFVCMGGSPNHMKTFSLDFKALLRNDPQYGQIDMIPYGDGSRFVIYKVGPVLFVSTGLGSSSMSIVLNEIIKLLYYAQVEDPILFRVGLSGGFNLECGTVVIAEEVVDEMMNSYYEVPILGKIVKLPAKLDRMLVGELKSLVDPEDRYDTIAGKTMCTSDFYEGQGRLDGAFCDFTENQKTEYISKLCDQDIVNVEMQGIPFAAITHRAGIRAAIVCITLIDKLRSDKPQTGVTLDEYYRRPQKLVARYIQRYLQMNRRRR